MNLEEQFYLSCYQDLSVINREKNVYLVKNIETGQIYVKKILTVYNKAVLERLMNSNINGIPRIIMLVENEGRLIVIEEYINGITLRKLIDDNGLLGEGYAKRVVNDICNILADLHSMNPKIIHRDIKPDNIMIMSDGSARLIDFNTARESSSGDKNDTVFMGTESYAAPEQYGFGQSDETTDIYALGVTLNYMLTGKNIREYVYGGDLGRIISKCTRIDKKDRFRNVSELMRELTDYGSSGKSEYNLTKFLPVGFRSLNPICMVIAGFTHAFMLFAFLSITYTSDRTPEHLVNIENNLFRIIFVLNYILAVSVGGNYLGIADHLPNVKNPFFRKLINICWGILLWIVIFMVAAFISVMIEM